MRIRPVANWTQALISLLWNGILAKNLYAGVVIGRLDCLIHDQGNISKN